VKCDAKIEIGLKNWFGSVIVVFEEIYVEIIPAHLFSEEHTGWNVPLIVWTGISGDVDTKAPTIRPRYFFLFIRRSGFWNMLASIQSRDNSSTYHLTLHSPSRGHGRSRVSRQSRVDILGQSTITGRIGAGRATSKPVDHNFMAFFSISAPKPKTQGRRKWQFSIRQPDCACRAKVLIVTGRWS